MNTATLASQTAISIPALEINGTPATPIANLNGTTPAAQSNYINATWQSSVSGTTTSASVELPYCSSSVFGVCKVDGATITVTNGVISAVGSGLTSVGLTAPPDLFTVGNSPLTSNGTITQTKTTVGTGVVLRGPTRATYEQPYVVQSGKCVTAALANNWTCAFPGAVAAGDALVVGFAPCGYCSTSLSGVPAWVVTDNAGSGDTFVSLYQFNDSTSGRIYASVVSAIGGATTITVSQTGATGTDVGILNAIEIHNADPTTPVDVVGDHANTCKGNTVTSTFATDLILGICFDKHGADMTTPGLGWSQINIFNQGSPGPSGTAIVGKVVTTTGTYTPYMNDGGAGAETSLALAIKGKSSGGPNTWFVGPLDVTYVPELFPDMAGQTGVTVSGASCTVKAIVDGLITSATCP
jgi:hypothetical protein